MSRRRFAYPESAGALALGGALFGALAAGLTALGNPASTGLCASCFLVNVAGGVGLHARESQSYLRPEIFGIVLGAFFAAHAGREFRVRGGGSTVSHFVGGAFLLFGCEVFIGCPIKALLRTASGGAAAAVGAAGLVAGVLLATLYLRDGFALDAPRELPEGVGLVLPAGALLLLLFASGSAATAAAGFPAGARHAPFLASAAAGLLFGAVGQRTRFASPGASAPRRSPGTTGRRPEPSRSCSPRSPRTCTRGPSPRPSRWSPAPTRISRGRSSPSPRSGSARS